MRIHANSQHFRYSFARSHIRVAGTFDIVIPCECATARQMCLVFVQSTSVSSGNRYNISGMLRERWVSCIMPRLQRMWSKVCWWSRGRNEDGDGNGVEMQMGMEAWVEMEMDLRDFWYGARLPTIWEWVYRHLAGFGAGFVHKSDGRDGMVMDIIGYPRLRHVLVLSLMPRRVCYISAALLSFKWSSSFLEVWAHAISLRKTTIIVKTTLILSIVLMPMYTTHVLPDYITKISSLKHAEKSYMCWWWNSFHTSPPSLIFSLSSSLYSGGLC